MCCRVFEDYDEDGDDDDTDDESDENDGMVLMMAIMMMIMVKHIRRKGGPDVYSSAEMNALQEKLLIPTMQLEM